MDFANGGFGLGVLGLFFLLCRFPELRQRPDLRPRDSFGNRENDRGGEDRLFGNRIVPVVDLLLYAFGPDVHLGRHLCLVAVFHDDKKAEAL